MKKSYSKTELTEQSKAVFKNYPTAKVVFGTTDGQFFLNESHANIHATAEGKVFKIENENIPSEGTKNKPANAADLIAVAATLETVEAVDAAKALELEGKNRATVLAAYDARIEELNKTE
ncbi:hypothetical protein FORMB_25280 [Formosa sp. Hel1_33_131]|uniref:hypothetical protein n=1 Tax=Formosa sp. Hel1_33_131 TaxID=1336794 RepID=UPI00084E2F62|nr:hypothetical protein [Formosa sp. Hel1_33_131]AOR29545.1 hypothetical protein FORMB_25280 [Formosa sp. Hel1_33_131]